jgi:hypothetical protein
MTELEAVRTQLVTNLTSRFMSPMVKLLDSEKKSFATNEKKIKLTIAQYEGEIERLIATLDKEQPAGCALIGVMCLLLRCVRIVPIEC